MISLLRRHTLGYQYKCSSETYHIRALGVSEEILTKLGKVLKITLAQMTSK